MCFITNATNLGIKTREYNIENKFGSHHAKLKSCANAQSEIA